MQNIGFPTTDAAPQASESLPPLHKCSSSWIGADDFNSAILEIALQTPAARNDENAYFMTSILQSRQDAGQMQFRTANIQTMCNDQKPRSPPIHADARMVEAETDCQRRRQISNIRTVQSA